MNGVVPQLGLIRQIAPKYKKIKNLEFIDKAKQSVYIAVSRVLSSKMAFILCPDPSFIVFWPDFCQR